MRDVLRRWSWSAAATALAALAVTAAWMSTGSGVPSDDSVGADAGASSAWRADRFLVGDQLGDPVNRETGRRGWRVATAGARFLIPLPAVDARAWLGVRARGAPGTEVVLRAADARFAFPAAPAGTLAVVGPLRARQGPVTVERVVGGRVEIGSAALSPDGVVALPAAGFYGIEAVESPRPFAWMGRRGNLAVAAAGGAKRARVSFEMQSLARRTVRLRIFAPDRSTAVRVRRDERRRIVLGAVPLVRRRAVIRLVSDWPGMRSSNDDRLLTFRISKVDATPAG